MRIAQICPLIERVPPIGYGGIELVVAHLCDELVRRGHEVTLFASGDSETLATLEAGSKKALRLDPDIVDPMVYHFYQLNQLIKKADQFDLIHSHVDYPILSIVPLLKTPVVHTLHKVFQGKIKMII